MPLFEFRCRECSHLEEVLQKYTDPPPAACPSCGKERTMDKEVSLTSFQLKGGGWYKDLYSSSPKDTKKSDGGGEKSGGEKSGGEKSGGSESGSSTGSKTSSDSSSKGTSEKKAAKADKPAGGGAAKAA